MYRVKKAIILAAGLGKRMNPITLTIPKPLISINGTRMIDSIIHALHKNKISEIYVIVGYKKEQFDYLKKINGIHLLYNPFFDTYNNIASLYIARQHLENSIILDGDQIINNVEVLKPLFAKSGYNAVMVNKYTPEWVMQVNDNTVTSCSKNGGTEGWQLYSISRWNSQDGKKLRFYLEKEFEQNNNRQDYWDDIAMFTYKSKFDLGIFPMQSKDVIEIDTIEELAALDNSYIRFFKDNHE